MPQGLLFFAFFSYGNRLLFFLNTGKEIILEYPYYHH